MIIAGNSNVASFDTAEGRLLLDGAPVPCHWVGAFRWEQFTGAHPAGARLRELSLQGPPTDWLFLAAGTHDVFEVCRAADGGDPQPVLARIVDHAGHAMLELRQRRPVAWLVFPQPVEAIRFSRLSAQDVHYVAQRLNRVFADVAAEIGVTVVDPFDLLSGQAPPPHVFQRDGEHLNRRGTDAYRAAMEAIVGRPLTWSEAVGAKPFEPHDELESFAHLVLREVGVPHDGGATHDMDGVIASVCDFARACIAAKGMDAEVTPETDLNDWGLDSLDWVDVYRHAAEALGRELTFGAELRELATVAAMVAHLAPTTPAHAGPTVEDFLTVVAATKGASPPALDDALARVAAMPAALAEAIHRQVIIALGGAPNPYGVVDLWLALAAHDTPDHAAQLLRAAAHPHRRFPVHPALVERILRPAPVAPAPARDARWIHEGRLDPSAVITRLDGIQAMAS